MKIDERLYIKDSEYLFENESIYIIQYFNPGENHFSLSSINDIDDNSSFEFLSDININSKISIVFNSSNNRIIGIYKEKKSNYTNKAFFFNLVIEAFIIKYKHNLNTCNEINILLNVDSKDVKKKKYLFS